jgi:hypothetical protein
MPEIFGDAVSSAAPNALSLAGVIRDVLTNPTREDRDTEGMSTWDSAAMNLRDAIGQLADR